MRTERGPDAVGLERAADLLARFLAHRGERTLQAYRLDIEDFAASLGEPPPAAVARLLEHGPRAAARRVLEYAVGLRRRDLAPATVARRLATLRALARLAAASGLVDWSLDVPTEAEIESGLDLGDADEVPYLFPRHPTEIDRLDVQHYALREALGANHLAPVSAPRRVLDAGSGSGQWGFDLCAEFPQALVIGVDLVAGKPRHPDRYRWVRANLLQGLPFVDGCFDFVHQRALALGVPLPAWPALVRELVRVTRPGGWLELAEPRLGADRVGPATQRFNDLALELAGSLGLDTTGSVFASLDGCLRDAGLANVARREVALPVGEWGGRVGSLMATDTRAAYARLAQLMHARGVLSLEEAHALLQRAQEECEELHTTGAFAIACGRRPSG